jgi:tetratricopeptide (TPR) repeat protein
MSKFIVLSLVVVALVGASGCSLYKRTVVQKTTVDGAKAFQQRKFEEAERLFREAIAADPDFETEEAKLAERFLANTLQAQFGINRKNSKKAEEAITVFKSVIAKNPGDGRAFRALAGLLRAVGRDDEWLKLVTERANDPAVPGDQRADVLTSLAARQFSCANEISDAEEVKKQVGDAYKFSKPAKAEDFDKLKKCATEGMALVDKALALQKEANVESDSTWSYKANLLIQKMRIAEMDGDSASQEKFKKEAEVAKEKYKELVKKKQEEAEKKVLAESSIKNAQNQQEAK